MFHRNTHTHTLSPSLIIEQELILPGEKSHLTPAFVRGKPTKPSVKMARVESIFEPLDLSNTNQYRHVQRETTSRHAKRHLELFRFDMADVKTKEGRKAQWIITRPWHGGLAFVYCTLIIHDLQIPTTLNTVQFRQCIHMKFTSHQTVFWNFKKCWHFFFRIWERSLIFHKKHVHKSPALSAISPVT